MIPRAVQQIFDTLESQSAEYSVKTTFLELYNEEITDLLATDVDMIKVCTTLVSTQKSRVGQAIVLQTFVLGMRLIQCTFCKSSI